MRIKPRAQILDVWSSMLAASYDKSAGIKWASENEPNSITDAEQLLCLIHPMNEIEAFALWDQESIQPDVASALAPLGGVRNIPRSVTDMALAYFTRHTAEDGQPRFTGASSFRTFGDEKREITEEQRGFEVVDSYSMSLTLCLAVLAFATSRETAEHNSDYRQKLTALRQAASLRLTAAMTGLLRSFVVNAVDPDSKPDQVMLSMLQQPNLTDDALRGRVAIRFRRLRAQLHSDLRLSVPEASKPEEDQLFECGWTWGVAEDARPVGFVQEPPESDEVGPNDGEFVKLDIAARSGVADTRPYLYFTVVALDGLIDLFARRTRALNLFNGTQQRLAEALQVRWELTQRYWSTVARFDRERWPLEDIPWRTSDGEESDYYSLLVTSVLLQDLINRTATEYDLNKAITILEDLAARGRITRRMTNHDLAMHMHSPGVPMRLMGSERTEDDPLLAWYRYDFTPLLLKRACQGFQLTNNVQARERLMDLAEAAMDQLESRRIKSGRAAGLWDDVTGLTPEGRTSVADGAPAVTRPSWYFTERVIESLVTAATGYEQNTPRSDRMLDHLVRLVNEADHLYNQELMATDVNDRSQLRTGLDEIELLIAQARDIAERQTGTAIALALRALSLLDGLAQGRQDPRRGR
jgi:hypothetical protein